MKNCWKLLVFAAIIPLFLTGCIFKSIDDLYAVPQQSSSYYELDKAIDSAMTSDMQYAAPVAGSNQQAVQMADLDGDGSNEALLFVKANGEKPMKVLIFKKQDGRYQNVSTIECDGTSFERVEYIQLDGRPGLELLLGFQVSDRVPHALGVYSIRDGQMVELLNASYAGYTTADLDQDGVSELCLLRQDGASGSASLYNIDAFGNMFCQAEAPLSSGSGEIKRLISGNIAEGVPAVFVTSVYGAAEDNALVTDIFALQQDGDTFFNITLQNGSNVSAQIVRNYAVYAMDVDDDSIIELPKPKQLRKNSASEDDYWLITWYHIGLDGSMTEQMTTYHNFAMGWYIEIPANWSRVLTISRTEPVNGTSGYLFSSRIDNTLQTQEIFTIYAFTGEDRVASATSDGRFILSEKGDVVYAAAIGTSELAESITQDNLISWFHDIHLDWNSGEV